jgi:hypothetical protein
VLVALYKVHIAIILHLATMATGKASPRLGILPSFFAHVLAQLASC